MDSPPELAFQVHGEGYPVLIIHGYELSGTAELPDFEPVFSRKPGYRRIYIDLPGMGATPAGNVQSLDDMFETLKRFIHKELRLSPFLLIGSSIGAHLAQAVAYEFRDLVQGLFLRVPAVIPDSSLRQLDVFKPVIEDVPLLESYPELVDQDIPVQTRTFLGAAQHKIADFLLPIVQQSDIKLLDSIRNDKSRYRVDKPMHSPDDPLMCPALIVTGRQDTAVGFRDAWRLMDAYPRATFAAVDRGTHGFPIDQSQRELFGCLVGDWLERVREAQADMARLKA